MKQFFLKKQTRGRGPVNILFFRKKLSKVGFLAVNSRESRRQN